MAIVRFLLWSGICVALGVFAASYEIGGRTPLAHAQALWQRQAPQVEKVKAGAAELAGDVKRQLAAPTEHHSADERDSVNRIIARRQQK